MFEVPGFKFWRKRFLTEGREALCREKLISLGNSVLKPFADRPVDRNHCVLIDSTKSIPQSAKAFPRPTVAVVIIGSADRSASYIVREVLLVRERERDTERERERERDRRKWRHHCRAKIGDEFTPSLAKNSHFSFLPSHFPFLPSRRGHHGGAEIRNEFTLSIAKIFFALRLCSPSFKWHEPRDEWSKTQDKWSNLAQSYFVLPIEKLNQINTKNYWK